jgi:catechol 2,3-dioxygenase-like lactoylglutathione lyase family enzyme
MAADALSQSAVPVHGLHHYAYRCRDAEETRYFYEDILGLPLVHVIKADSVPSTGENFPYVHIFFEMTDGSCIAFFDLGDDQAAVPSPNTPKWVNHIAFKVDSTAQLEKAKARLEAAGVQVIGPTDHHFVQSIYFFDPNGVRLELTCEVGSPEYVAKKRRDARAELDEWTHEKARRRDVKERQTA